MKSIFSLGNRKLPTTTAIWNIPAVVTCPGATVACKAYCYALKAERFYLRVLPKRQSNFKLAKSKKFIATVMKELQKLVNAGKINKVRIHESGDFFSQAYIDAWRQIAVSFPDLIFYAYTRSYMYDFSGLQSLANVRLIFSLDETSNKKAIIASKNFARISRIIGKHTEITLPQSAIVCPGDCKICSVCSSKNRHNTILFRKH